MSYLPFQHAQSEQENGWSIRRGFVVSAVDAAKARVRCRLGEGEDLLETDWLPWLTWAGRVRVWSCPVVGEVVMLLCDRGNLVNALVMRAQYTETFPAPANDEALTQMAFDDETTLAYHDTDHSLTVEIPEDHQGTVNLVTPKGAVSLSAPEGRIVIEAAEGTLELKSTSLKMTADEVTIEAEETRITGNLSVGGEVQDHTGTLADIRAIFNSHTHPVSGTTAGKTPQVMK